VRQPATVYGVVAQRVATTAGVGWSHHLSLATKNSRSAATPAFCIEAAELQLGMDVIAGTGPGAD
jgi:hypothetical protein